MKTLLTLFVFLCSHSSALAAQETYQDPAVRNFLHAPAESAVARLPVVVLYRQQENPAGSSAREAERRMLQVARSTERAVFPSLGASAQETLWLVNGSVAELSRTQLQALVQEPRVRAVLSAKRKVRIEKIPSTAASFTYGLQKMNVPGLLAIFPEITGKGVTVGILDSGLDAGHPDLKGKLRAYKDFSSEHTTVPTDGYHHGTHVAGTVAGGSASGRAIGMAPDAQLVIGRIFDGNGESETLDILRAMQWIADPDGNPSTADFPRVVNSSWSDSDPYADRTPEDDPFCRAVDGWVQIGIVPVFAAGNNGSTPGSVGLPAGCPRAFAVGATNINDQSPWFSSSGPAIWKTMQIVKPDVAAPGLDIFSTVPGGYETMSGTSMSTPHVTGAFALLFQAKPELTVEAAEQALLAGVVDLGDAGKDNDFGWGRPDMLKSVSLLKGALRQPSKAEGK